MESIDAILSEVDKLKPNEKLQLLHQLVDRMLATSAPESTHSVNFEKYVGIGKGVWGPDAQAYINESRIPRYVSIYIPDRWQSTICANC